MNRSSRLVPGALAALVLLCGLAAAQPPAGTVHVVVRGSGRPAAGLEVAIESAGDSSYGAAAETDAEGTASFADVPVGEVSVRVYDAAGQLVVEGRGILERAGEDITLILQPDPGD